MPPKKKSVAAAESGSEDEGAKSAGSGSESSPSKKRGTGLMKPLKLSKELSGLLDLPADEEMSRPQVNLLYSACPNKRDVHSPRVHSVSSIVNFDSVIWEPKLKKIFLSANCG